MPGIVCTQFASCPAGAFGPNHMVAPPSAFFLSPGRLLSTPTDQKSAGVDSNLPGLKKNADGGATVWFGPKAPAGNEANWVQTMPGKGYNLLLRLYGPLEPWFNQTWQPGDLELVN